jgi:hypothetical protein
MRNDIEFFYAVSHSEARKPLLTAIGRGADGTLWAEAGYLGLGREALEEIRQRDARLLFVNPNDGCTYVEAQAIAERCGSVEMEKAVLAAKEQLVDRLHPRNFRA